MAKSLESLRETETTIIWNETDDLAEMWTASAKVRKEWDSFGFPSKVFGGGWKAVVPKDRITYKPFKKSSNS